KREFVQDGRARVVCDRAKRLRDGLAGLHRVSDQLHGTRQARVELAEPVPASVSQVERREEITNDREDEKLGPEAETQQTDHAEQHGGDELDDSKLVRPQLEVGADQVTLQLAGPLLGGDPDGRAGRLEAPPQLLADVSEGSIRSSDRFLGGG